MSDTLFISGLILTCIVAYLGFDKKLRSSRTLTHLLIPAFIIALIGLWIRSSDTEQKGANAADALLSPLVYILCYAGLRALYKYIYNMEPTCDRYSWYDSEEGRKQNWLDVVVHIVPMLIAFVFPVAIKGIFG